MLLSGLGYIFTPPQIEILRDYIMDFHRSSRRLWHSSFAEALLMRFFYVLSYFMILTIEVYAIVTRRRQFPIPSRSLLSTGAVLGLILIGGASFFGLSAPTDDN